MELIFTPLGKDDVPNKPQPKKQRQQHQQEQQQQQHQQQQQQQQISPTSVTASASPWWERIVFPTSTKEPQQQEQQQPLKSSHNADVEAGKTEKERKPQDPSRSVAYDKYNDPDSRHHPNNTGRKAERERRAKKEQKPQDPSRSVAYDKYNDPNSRHHPSNTGRKAERERRNRKTAPAPVAVPVVVTKPPPKKKSRCCTLSKRGMICIAVAAALLLVMAGGVVMGVNKNKEIIQASNVMAMTAPTMDQCKANEKFMAWANAYEGDGFGDGDKKATNNGGNLEVEVMEDSDTDSGWAGDGLLVDKKDDGHGQGHGHGHDHGDGHDHDEHEGTDTKELTIKDPFRKLRSRGLGDSHSHNHHHEDDSSHSFAGNSGGHDDSHHDIDNSPHIHMSKNSHPQLVSMGNNHKSHVCSGTVIANHAILTAAHCFTDEKNGEMKPLDWIDFHKHDLTDFKGVVRKIITKKNVYRHPHFNYKTLRNDVAIVFFSTNDNFELSENIQTMALYEDGSGPADMQELQVLGWGTTSNDPSSNPNVPHTAMLDYVTNEDCTSSAYNWKKGSIDGSMLCGYSEVSKTLCNLDSGGPIVMKDSTGKTVQVGISSFVAKSHYGCAEEKYPNVFARVTSGLTWIKEIVCEVKHELCAETKQITMAQKPATNTANKYDTPIPSTLPSMEPSTTPSMEPSAIPSAEPTISKPIKSSCNEADDADDSVKKSEAKSSKKISSDDKKEFGRRLGKEADTPSKGEDGGHSRNGDVSGSKKSGKKDADATKKSKRRKKCDKDDAMADSISSHHRQFMKECKALWKSEKKSKSTKDLESSMMAKSFKMPESSKVPKNEKLTSLDGKGRK